jgi:hypothetical protein
MTKIEETTKILSELYLESRAKVPTTLTDGELALNDDFKRCFIINYIIQVLSSPTDRDAKDGAEILLEAENYDVERFIDRFYINFTFNNNGLQYDFGVKKDDSTTETSE